MVYEKDEMPDGTVYERYEGTPEEILELMNCMPRELKKVDDKSGRLNHHGTIKARKANDCMGSIEILDGC